MYSAPLNAHVLFWYNKTPFIMRKLSRFHPLQSPLPADISRCNVQDLFCIVSAFSHIFGCKVNTFFSYLQGFRRKSFKKVCFCGRLSLFQVKLILRISYVYPTCILRISYVYPTYILRVSYVGHVWGIVGEPRKRGWGGSYPVWRGNYLMWLESYPV